MTRRALKQVDDFWHQRSGIHVQIYLNPSNRFETSKIFGEVLMDDSAIVLKGLANKFINDNFSLSFVPIIEVNRQEDPFHRAEVAINLSAHRFWYANAPEDKFMRVDWDHPEGEMSRYAYRWYPGSWHYQAKGREFILPIKIDEKTSYLPYTEDTWNGIQNLINILKRADERLNEILGTEDGGFAVLSDAGQQFNLLLPGDE